MGRDGKDSVRPFMKPNVALVRGKFLNQYEMQSYEPLVDRYDLTAFGSMRPFHDTFAFPTVKLWSPMDIPNFPYKMPIVNRLTIDAQYLWGLEKRLTGFDIAHTAETYYHYTSQALRAKREGRVQAVVVTVLETIAHNNEGIWGRRGMKETARNEVDHFIAVSKRAKDALIAEGTNPNKITVIPYGIDTKRFSPSKEKKYVDRLNLLFVGRLEKEKGILDLLEVFKRLSHRKLHLTIVGTGSLKLEPMKNVSVITSSYDNMPKIYKSADIFVAPSKAIRTWEEQYNIALLEAQASGLAIITTRCGAIPENVGSAAFIIPPNDISKLYEALLRVITDQSLRESLAKASRLRAESVHDVRIISEKIDRLYHEILSTC